MFLDRLHATTTAGADATPNQMRIRPGARSRPVDGTTVIAPPTGPERHRSDVGYLRI